MKPSFTFDTSALVSLGHTGLIYPIINSFNIIITNGIIEELKTISEKNDEDAKSAIKWLKISNNMEKREIEKRKAGEDELFEICKKEGIYLITDDIRAIKRFKDKIKCYYSIHIIYNDVQKRHNFKRKSHYVY